MRNLIAMSSAVLLSTSALGQETATMVIGGVQQSVLRTGTPITLRTTVELTTKGKHLKVGDRFSLETADPVSLDGRLIIPVGSPAIGEVTSVRNKGMWGKSGNIETRLISVTANGRVMRISGSTGDKGVKAGGGAIAMSAIVFLPAGFFMTGTSAVIPPGTRVIAQLAEDVPLQFADSGPAPMTVSHAAVPMASATVAASPTAATIVPVALTASAPPRP